MVVSAFGRRLDDGGINLVFHREFSLEYAVLLLMRRCYPMKCTGKQASALPALEHNSTHEIVCRGVTRSIQYSGAVNSRKCSKQQVGVAPMSSAAAFRRIQP